MKKITGLLAAAGMMLGLASCGSDAYRTAQFTCVDSIPLEACDTMTLAVDHSIVYFQSVPAGAQVCEKLNAQIVNLVFGDDLKGQSLEEASRSYLKDLEENYQSDAGSDFRDLTADGGSDAAAFCNWQNSLIGNLGTSYKDKYLTYTFLSSLYYGGAHGSHLCCYRILNLETGEAVTEDDIFAQGYEQAVSELLVAGIYKKFEGEEFGQDYLDSIFFDDVHPNGNVAISEDGLTWCFNTYEIAPYYVGAVEVTLPWSELSGYLSNEFNFE